jgi:hypothetical protein
MTRLRKLAVLGVKTLGNLTTFGLSGFLVFDRFYVEQPAEVSVGVTGTLVMTILLFISLSMMARYRKNKEVAYEVAKNLGQPSESVNPTVLEILNMISYSFPFLIISFFTYIIQSYNGDITAALLTLAGAVAGGHVFKIIGVNMEQSYLRAAITVAETQRQDAIVAKLKAELDKKTV